MYFNKRSGIRSKNQNIEWFLHPKNGYPVDSSKELLSFAYDWWSRTPTF